MFNIRTIEIPNYPDKVLISKARRAVLYVREGSKLRGKTTIPKSFLSSPRYEFDERGVLVDKETKEPKLANPFTAGKPRYWVVNFQDIWNQTLTKQDRARRTDKLKEIFTEHIKDIPVIRRFPIGLGIDIYDIECPVDISNKGVIYTKVIEDVLVSTKRIPDDSVEYINDSGRCRFIKVEKIEDKKMVINIFR